METVYCATAMYPDLATYVRTALPNANVINVKVLERGVVAQENEDDFLENAEIVIGNNLVAGNYLYKFKKLKWYHTHAAGIDIITNKINLERPLPSFTLTRRTAARNISAQYVITYILATERKVLHLAELQTRKLWNWSRFDHSRPLESLTIGILGVGSIGSEVARLCKAFGMKTFGMVRNIDSTQNRSSYIDVYRSKEDMSDFLMNSDYLCCCLPSTPETKGLLSGNILSYCKDRGTVLINIGRGDLIDEETLVKALTNKWLGGAVLDVVPKEPLSEDSPLWTLPNVVITPHISGWSKDPEVCKAVVDEFVVNYYNFLAGKPMNYVIDWRRGY
ncbi:hypothetical protein CHS0354_021763 [Potamilus streckersoni]|uniref:D-isomer specific 2-hydroxyacid dehydrogenase NAD-binding domain-containing protein n=1 Tax=Potamilus streckersoni TaxID=2493646 RepID=A0AAE0WH06_9BIVA|nr:hypothetical protein CHS0354_021763 [Potamilus streckersoni]